MAVVQLRAAAYLKFDVDASGLPWRVRLRSFGGVPNAV